MSGGTEICIKPNSISMYNTTHQAPGEKCSYCRRVLLFISYFSFEVILFDSKARNSDSAHKKRTPYYLLFLLSLPLLQPNPLYKALLLTLYQYKQVQSHQNTHYFFSILAIAINRLGIRNHLSCCQQHGPQPIRVGLHSFGISHLVTRYSNMKDQLPGGLLPGN
jgi:hypothetical protein